jgi:hypothetical protein
MKKQRKTLDEKIEKGGYVMTIPFGVMKVVRRYRVVDSDTLWYEVKSPNPTDEISFHVQEYLCKRRATEQEWKEKLKHYTTP